MTDLLFDIPAGGFSRLEMARARLALAEMSLCTAAEPDAPQDALFTATLELKNAENCVRLIEALEIRKMRGSEV